MDTLTSHHRRPPGATEPESETAAKEPGSDSPERRPYRKPVPELRGQIKPSLLGSPPLPP